MTFICMRSSLHSATRLGLLCVYISLGASPNVARAAGVEDTVGGAEGLGRAANFGRSADFMATLENPANLAIIGAHVGGELRVPWLRACYDRAADPDVTYRMDSSGQVIESFEAVCNEGFPLPTGNFGWAESFGNYGIGVGFFTPAGVGNTEWGNDTIYTFAPNPAERGTPTIFGESSSNLLSPTRQMAMRRTALAGFVMSGFGAQPTWWLRLGVSTGFGMVQIHSKSVVSSTGGTFNDTDIISEVKARDWVVGRATGSVVLTPLPWLELFTVSQFHSDARARGKMTLTANGLQNVPTSECVTDDPTRLTSKCTVEDVTVNIPFTPMEVTFGARFVWYRGERHDLRDTLRDEIMDFEIDVAYAKTSNVDAFRVKVHDADADNPEDIPRIRLGNFPGSSALFVRQNTDIPKQWKDTWTIRAGSDINIVPSKFAIRLGASYATNAVPNGYMNIDYWPVRKIGAHAGFTVALSERLQAHVGYAHLFYQDVTVEVGEGEVRDIATNMANDATAVNEGDYRASQDIFSAQLNIGF